MVKTISQIRNEMDTIKLIKEALDVDELKARKLLTEWTTPEEKKTVTLTGGTIGTPVTTKVPSGETILGRKEVEELLESIEIMDKLKGLATFVINVNLEKDQSAEDVAKKLAEAIKSRGGEI